MNRLVIACLFALLGLSSKAQTNEKSELEVLNALYNARIDSSAFVFTGAEYVNQSYRKVGNPYFPLDSFVNGSIRYDGQWYTGVPLQWDVLQNYILTRSLNGYAKIILRSDLIDSFSIDGHTVVKLWEDKSVNLYNTDFYDVLYRGKTEVYARRQKETFSSIGDDKVIYHFRAKDKFYVKKNGIFYRVSNRKDVLNLLTGHSSAINRSVRREGLNWRRNFEASLVTAAYQYDQLTH